MDKLTKIFYLCDPVALEKLNRAKSDDPIDSIQQLICVQPALE